MDVALSVAAFGLEFLLPLFCLSLDFQQIVFMMLYSTSGIPCKFTCNQICLMKVTKTKSTQDLGVESSGPDFFFYPLRSSHPQSFLPPTVRTGYSISCHFVLLIKSSISHSAKSGSLSTSVEPQGLLLLAIFDFVIDIIYYFL